MTLWTKWVPHANDTRKIESRGKSSAGIMDMGGSEWIIVGADIWRIWMLELVHEGCCENQ